MAQPRSGCIWTAFPVFLLFDGSTGLLLSMDESRTPALPVFWLFCTLHLRVSVSHPAMALDWGAFASDGDYGASLYVFNLWLLNVLAIQLPVNFMFLVHFACEDERKWCCESCLLGGYL
jgi:hypothetical protein